MFLSFVQSALYEIQYEKFTAKKIRNTKLLQKKKISKQGNQQPGLLIKEPAGLFDSTHLYLNNLALETSRLFIICIHQQ